MKSPQWEPTHPLITVELPFHAFPGARCGQNLRRRRRRRVHRKDAAHDAFWGERYAHIVDPFGHGWGLATPKEQLTEEQIKERSAQFWKQPANQ